MSNKFVIHKEKGKTKTSVWLKADCGCKVYKNKAGKYWIKTWKFCKLHTESK